MKSPRLIPAPSQQSSHERTIKIPVFKKNLFPGENDGIPTRVQYLMENKPKLGSFHISDMSDTSEKTLIWLPFLFAWRIRSNIVLFAKIRQICTSPIDHQCPCNRGEFCHIVYPFWHPLTLPECECEALFFQTRV